MPRDTGGASMCPNCGAEVPSGRTFCRECGASEDSGWYDEGPAWEQSEEGLDDFDYDEYVRREFPESRPPGLSARRVLLILIVSLVVAGLLFSTLF